MKLGAQLTGEPPRRVDSPPRISPLAPRRRRCMWSSRPSLLLYLIVTTRWIQEAPHPLGHLLGDTICTRRPQSSRRRLIKPMGTMGYMDLVFFMIGELTTELDANTFNDIVLRLLTGLFGLLVLLFSPTRTTNQKKTTPFCRRPHAKVIGLFWRGAQAAATHI
jgi:hypothetical protein